MGISCDFSGYATRNDLLCGDGRIIKKDAFKDCDGKTVSLVWNHDHSNPESVLGHALLENRDDGVYAYCTLNDTEAGRHAKELVQHGDVTALSIYANKLKQNGNNVVHGIIRELSIVLAGANPGAYIDFVMEHSDEDDEDTIGSLYAGYDERIIIHSADTANNKKEDNYMAENTNNTKKTENDDEETVAQVFNTLTEKQKTVVYALIGQALESAGNNDDDEEDNNMKHNIFDTDEEQGNYIYFLIIQVVLCLNEFEFHIQQNHLSYFR